MKGTEKSVDRLMEGKVESQKTKFLEADHEVAKGT